MIHFVVAAGAPEVVARLAPRLVPALEASRFVAGPTRLERAPSGGWAAAAVEVPDPLASRRLVVEGEDLVVLNGPALVRPSRQAHVAEEALAALRDGGSRAVGDALGGTWNVVASTPRTGLRAFTDPSGVYPLYWCQVAGAVLVANRSSTLAAVGGGAAWDVGALAWLLGQNRLHGSAMPVAGALHLRSDDELRLLPGETSAELAPVPRDLWPGPDGEPGRDDLPAADWDAVTEELVESVRPLGSLGAPVDLMLTGGKDSRLCLALAKAAGILDGMRVVTTGGADSPEVQAASAVARAAGCTHHHSDPATGRVDVTYRAPSAPAAGSLPGPAGARSPNAAPAPGGAAPPRSTAVRPRGAGAGAAFRRGPWIEDMDEVWRRLRQSVHRYDGTLCLWDGVTGRLGGPARIQVKGFGGELYRTHQYIDGGPFPSARRSLRLLRFEQTPDPLGLLRPEVLDAQEAWLRDFADDAGRRARFDLAPDLLRATYLQGHWNGPMAQFTPGLVQVNPLLTPVGLRANARLNGPARQRERFHHEVMRRAAPELVEVPFLQNRWQRALRAQARMVASGAGPLSRERLAFQRYAVSGRVRNGLRLAALAPRPLVPRERLRTIGRATRPTPSRLLKTWQWRFLGSQAPAIGELFDRAARDTPLGEVCDVDRLVALGRGAGDVTDPLVGRTLLSAVSVALAMLGEAEPVVDEPVG